MRIFLILMAAVLVSGCAALQQGNAERDEVRLTKAGFRVLVADTAERRTALAGLPSYSLQQTEKNGVVYYRYADPARGRIYVGGAAEYDAYQKLTVRQRSHRASNLASQTATNWGTLGPMVW